MHILLTLNHCPHWAALAERCELPLLVSQDTATDAPGYFLSGSDPLTLLPSLSAADQLWLGTLGAEQALAAALLQGLSLSKAAAHWRDTTQLLLDTQRQQRQQVRLFDLTQALTQPHSLRRALNLREAKPGASLADKHSPLVLVAAYQYLAQQPELQQLNLRLQASCTPLCDIRLPSVDIDAFVAQQQQLAEANSSLTQALKNQEKTLADAQTALKQRDTQLQQQEPVLKKHETTVKAQEATLKTQEATLKQQEATLKKHSANDQAQAKNLAEVSTERDLILAQLHKVQEELETYYLKLQDKAKAHNSTIAIVQERDTQLQQYQQHCQHLEHLLHQANQQEQLSIQQQQQLEQRYQESEQSYQQLEQYYRQLEQGYRVLEQEQQKLAQIHAQLQQEQLQAQQEQLQTQQEHKHALLARDKQHAREAAKLEAELRKTKARAASAEYAGSLLQQELEDIKRSRVWKGTNPIRSFSRLLRKGNPQQQQLIQEVALLLTSEYFDVEWYLTHYPDVREGGINPAEHYLLYGAQEGRLPGPLFDGNWYKQHYPDVAEADINPLLHFIKFGQQEGRNSSPVMLTNDQHSES